MTGRGSITSNADEEPDRARTQPERRSASERRILEAALEVVARVGVERVTLERISQEAGCSVGLTVYLFESRANLLRQLAIRLQASAYRRGIESVTAGPTGLDAVLRTVELYFRVDVARARTNMRAFFELLAVGVPAEPELAKYATNDDRLGLLLSARIAEGIKDGSIDRSFSPAVTAAFLTALLRGSSLAWLSDSRPVHLAAVQRRVVELAREYFSTPQVRGTRAPTGLHRISTGATPTTAAGRLLSAAQELVVSRGVAGMAIAEVATNAGYSRGQTANVFGTKRRLIEALVAHIENEGATFLGVGGPRSLRDVVLTAAALIESEWTPAAASCVLLNELIHEQSPFNELIAQHERRIRHALTAVIRQGQANSSLRRDLDGERDSVVVFGLLRGIALMKSDAPGEFRKHSPILELPRFLASLERDGVRETDVPPTGGEESVGTHQQAV